MSRSTTYEVAKSFSRRPGGRKRANGAYSGEEFRESVALPLLLEFDEVVFDLTGSAGYTSGFLDEAFGGLALHYSLSELQRRISIVARDDPGSVDIAWERIRDASRESKG